MNKQCKSCGANVPVDAKFCQVCGRSDFVINNQTTNPSYNQTWQPSAPQNKPKKRKTGLIIGVIAVVLILIVVISTVLQKQEYGNSTWDGESNNNSESNSEELYYSKGSFDGLTYTNKWADIQFSLPEGFSNADLEKYSAVENSNTECGFYFVADDAMSQIYVCYEKLPTFPVYDEEKYLDAVMNSFEAENDTSSVTYKTYDEYSTVDIAGYTYEKAGCEINVGNNVFLNTIYVRKLGDYMICISVISSDQESNDNLINNITVAK